MAKNVPDILAFPRLWGCVRLLLILFEAVFK